MPKHLWQDVFPAVTTQFTSDSSLDLPACTRHWEAMLASGVAGLIVNGSLGENQSLAPEEKRTVLRHAVEVAAGRVPVLSGVAESSTRAACEFVRDGVKLGAAGFMVMPAMTYKADPREALNHFRTVANACPTPWMLYNNPVGYAVDVTPTMMQELVDLPNLIAVKESSADTRRITEIRTLLGDRLSLFVGVDDIILQSAALGIDGWVAGSGIAFPAENQRFWELTRAGDYVAARKLLAWFHPLLKLDTHVKFVQYIKLAVQEVGLGSEVVRAPRMPLVGEERERVLAIIHAGIANRPSLA